MLLRWLIWPIQNDAMNANMIGFRWFSNSLRPCALDENSLSIGRVHFFSLEEERLILTWSGTYYKEQCSWHDKALDFLKFN